jgi:hypothetical protein
MKQVTVGMRPGCMPPGMKDSTSEMGSMIKRRLLHGDDILTRFWDYMAGCLEFLYGNA